MAKLSRNDAQYQSARVSQKARCAMLPVLQGLCMVSRSAQPQWIWGAHMSLEHSKLVLAFTHVLFVNGHATHQTVDEAQRLGARSGCAIPAAPWKCRLALMFIADAYSGRAHCTQPPLSQHCAIESEANRHFICNAALSIAAASTRTEISFMCSHRRRAESTNTPKGSGLDMFRIKL
jgi:hypothetical protein